MAQDIMVVYSQAAGRGELSGSSRRAKSCTVKIELLDAKARPTNDKKEETK